MTSAAAFHGIVRLLSGDAVAKALHFLAFIWMARVLGVERYGVLEFALATLLYFQLAADAGIEVWATRQTARLGVLGEGAGQRVAPHERQRNCAAGDGMGDLAGTVLPLRLGLAAVAFGLLLAILPLLPDFASLRSLLLVFGLTLVVQALSLKWAVLGQQRMRSVAAGLVTAQVVFAGLVVALVRRPEDVLWVAAARVAGDAAMALVFGASFVRSHGYPRPRLRPASSARILRSAVVVGLTLGLGVANYNFDSLLLGFLVGSSAVGWYAAAYKPITVVLALPATYFIGLFPALSDAWSRGEAEFAALAERALRYIALAAPPVAIGGTLLASPIIGLLFGPAYAEAVPVLRILAWSAALVLLRGIFKHGLVAADRQDLDLRCAAAAVALNVALNLVLIPRYGILGAAVATVASELVWLGMAVAYMRRHVVALPLVRSMARPAVAGVAMAGLLLAAGDLRVVWPTWPLVAVGGVGLYVAVLWLCAAFTSPPTSSARSTRQ